LTASGARALADQLAARWADFGHFKEATREYRKRRIRERSVLCDDNSHTAAILLLLSLLNAVFCFNETILNNFLCLAYCA
jgi:hypothetical protein